LLRIHSTGYNQQGNNVCCVCCFVQRRPLQRGVALEEVLRSHPPSFGVEVRGPSLVTHDLVPRMHEGPSPSVLSTTVLTGSLRTSASLNKPRQSVGDFA
jgi:hypothetical protein